MAIFSSLAVTSCACLLASATVLAQGPQPLDRMLSQVEANTGQYNAAVPSFLCDEHISSQEFHEGKLKHETTADAVFRVTRPSSPGGALTESREVKAIDGKPSAGKKINMPIAFSGGFSGALAKYLSAEHRQCFEYGPDASASSADHAAFTFIAKEAAANATPCASIPPGTTGKFTIDSASMQVTHIERTVHTTAGKDHVLGTASVDFAPVTFSAKPFWLPVTIIAFTTETPKTNAFRFTAHYSNYHRFAATSTILPASSDPPGPPPSR